MSRRHRLRREDRPDAGLRVVCAHAQIVADASACADRAVDVGVEAERGEGVQDFDRHTVITLAFIAMEALRIAANAGVPPKKLAVRVEVEGEDTWHAVRGPEYQGAKPDAWDFRPAVALTISRSQLESMDIEQAREWVRPLVLARVDLHP